MAAAAAAATKTAVPRQSPDRLLPPEARHGEFLGETGHPHPDTYTHHHHRHRHHHCFPSVESTPGARGEEEAGAEEGARPRSPSPEVQVLTKEEAARMRNGGGGASGATTLAERPAARPSAETVAAGPSPARWGDSERQRIEREERSRPAPSGGSGGAWGRLADDDAVFSRERRRQRQHEAASGLEEDRGRDGGVERRRGRERGRAGWRPVADGPRWRPVSWSEFQKLTMKWRPVSSSEAQERIKRPRLEAPGFGGPERAWYGGRGGRGVGC